MDTSETRYHTRVFYRQPRKMTRVVYREPLAINDMLFQERERVRLMRAARSDVVTTGSISRRQMRELDRIRRWEDTRSSR